MGRWQDKAWILLVGWLDILLRRCESVHEFTADPECLLRLALRRTRRAVRLADDIVIQAGETVGDLHLWNEHLPPFPPAGPDLRWAKLVARLLRHSLTLMARHVATGPPWSEVRAFRAEIAVGDGRRATRVARAAGRYGFEVKASPPSALRAFHRFGDALLLWGLARAFNPAALGRHPFLRDRLELWITREALVARYGGTHARPGTDEAARPAARSPWADVDRGRGQKERTVLV